MKLFIITTIKRYTFLETIPSPKEITEQKTSNSLMDLHVGNY